MQRILILMDIALKTAVKDLPLAREQADTAWRISLRFRVRLPYQIRQLFCRGCKKLIVPGINARVRLASKNPRGIRITCLDCGRIYRKVNPRDKRSVKVI
ncbi:MAG: RNase P subunit [Thaumarchaeota archaeon]|nr:RNase P subunit [Nitrososphaerota archaeon]